ncbi:MAG: extracellular solute-binding protein family 3 [Conexibacter sp.]|nr:extracellular solute-binding protein family 3 [Conexibacter sp.]
MTKTPTRLAAPLVVLALAGLGVTGCGSSNKTNASTTPAAAAPQSTATSAPAGGAADPAVEALVPAAARSRGTLAIATDPTYAPSEFVDRDGKTIVGMDVDLGNAIAAKMGLRADFQKSTFDAIIPGLAAKRYDLGMSSFTDTRERQRTVDFVTYFTAGTSFYVRASGGPDITGLGSLCGRRVAVEKGTTQADDSAAQGRRCVTAGRPNVTVLVFPDQNGANLALSSGRADVGMVDSPVAAYIVRQSGGQFRLAGTTYGTAPYGVAIPKGSGLDRPVLAAVRAAIADGSYRQALEKWGVQAGAISDPRLNGATS